LADLLDESVGHPLPQESSTDASCLNPGPVLRDGRSNCIVHGLMSLT
jgi:hypothetical protein